MKTIMRTRYWMRFTWRLVIVLAVLWVVWGVRGTVSSLLTSFAMKRGGDPLYWLTTLAFTLLTVGVTAALMLFLEKRVIRWLVPMPSRGCPNCGYPVPTRPGPCPECGFDAGN